MRFFYWIRHYSFCRYSWLHFFYGSSSLFLTLAMPYTWYSFRSITESALDLNRVTIKCEGWPALFSTLILLRPSIRETIHWDTKYETTRTLQWSWLRVNRSNVWFKYWESETKRTTSFRRTWYARSCWRNFDRETNVNLNFVTKIKANKFLTKTYERIWFPENLNLIKNVLGWNSLGKVLDIEGQ